MNSLTFALFVAAITVTKLKVTCLSIFYFIGPYVNSYTLKIFYLVKTYSPSGMEGKATLNLVRQYRTIEDVLVANRFIYLNTLANFLFFPNDNSYVRQAAL